VDNKDEDFSHRAHRTTAAGTRETAPGEPYHHRPRVQGCTARADCVTLLIRQPQGWGAPKFWNVLGN
jgi:hypothetical protein